MEMSGTEFYGSQNCHDISQHSSSKGLLEMLSECSGSQQSADGTICSCMVQGAIALPSAASEQLLMRRCVHVHGSPAVLERAVCRRLAQFAVICRQVP
jgi:hypothetical protein